MTMETGFSGVEEASFGVVFEIPSMAGAQPENLNPKPLVLSDLLAREPKPQAAFQRVMGLRGILVDL